MEKSAVTADTISDIGIKNNALVDVIWTTIISAMSSA